MKNWRTLNNPEAFQGNIRKKAYFEGWYNKIVDCKNESILAFIPTIALNKKTRDSHAAIQFFNGLEFQYYYFKYPLDEFENFSKTTYDIRIGNNYFNRSGISIDINKDGQEISGNIEYKDLINWPKKIAVPGAMGWLTYLPLLETYHGIVSMNHTLKGSLNLNGRNLNFNDGKGYIEKDWGKSFPIAWIWMQSNHFSDINLSFMCSIARIPFLKTEVMGLLSVLWLNGKIYKFTSYTGAKIAFLKIKTRGIRIVLKDKRYILDIDALQGKTVDMKAPSSGNMSAHCMESLNSSLGLKVYKRQKNNRYLKILDDLGTNSGLEIMVNEYFDRDWRKNQNYYKKTKANF